MGVQNSAGLDKLLSNGEESAKKGKFDERRTRETFRVPFELLPSRKILKMTPTEFEKKVKWIESILKGQSAEVKWNDKIPDPDNPDQQRQIDITIKRDGFLIIVECRLHSVPQDVTWIEELYGRRISLKANSVIAVSASGFTKGAVLKAERLGIILRDFRSLTEDEVKDWGLATDAFLEYIRYLDTILYLVNEPNALYSGNTEQPIFTEMDGRPWPIETILKQAASTIEKLDRRQGSIRMQVFTKKLFYKGRQVCELIFQSNYKKVDIPLRLPVVSIYASPGLKGIDTVYIQGNAGSDFEIYRKDKVAFLIVDLSVVVPKDNQIFRSIKFDFKKPVALGGIKLIAQKADSLSLLKSQIRTIRRDDNLYKSLIAQGPDEWQL